MIRRQFILDLHNELIVDNFAGGGGASTAIELALGRNVDHAINHCAKALGMHRINHPQTVHHCEDIFDIDPLKVTEGRPVGLAHFSPDCFPAGTLVMTDKGYRAIEDIEVGDSVLTHKLRWRKVTEANHTRKTLLNIRGHGHPGLLVSSEHPFYARRRVTTWNNPERTYRHSYQPAGWIPASMLEKGWYWATPREYPEQPIPEVPGRGMDIDERLMWLIGRYLGDGWTRLTETRAELVITCGKHEAASLRDILDQWKRMGTRSEFGELAWHERHTGTAFQFSTNHRGFVTWLREHFGHRAESKRIPAWLLGAPTKLRESLLAGYLSADGHRTPDFWECTTVSKELAFGIKATANSIGKTVAVYTGPNSKEIEGRAVNSRNVFRLRWRHQVDAEHEQTFEDEEAALEWCPIRASESADIVTDVFNIGVEEDESYVVEGIVVHNCKHFSKAKGGKPLDKRIRGLVLVMLKWAKIRSRVMTMENVEEITTWGPLKYMERNGVWGWFPDPDHKGRTWKAFLDILSVGIAADHPDLPEILSVLDGTVTLEDCVRGFGYHYEAREIRACDYGTLETNFGAPTIRKRLFMVARRDGKPIVWPEPTRYSPKDKSAPRGARPWRTIAECLDWSLPCPSIFLTGAQAKAARCRRPLAPSTLRRIAAGIDRYVLRSKEPFLVSLTHQGGDRIESVSEPGKTITGAHRGEKALVSPVMMQRGHKKSNSKMVKGADEPMRTQATAGEHCLTEAKLAPFLTEHANASAQRSFAPDEPMRTQCGEVKGGHFALVSPVVVNTSNGKFDEAPSRARSVEEPLPPVTTSQKFAMVTGTLVHTAHGDQDKNGKKRGRGAHDVRETMPAVLASPDGALASAILVGAGGPVYSGKPKPVEAPMNAQTTENHAAIASVNMVKLRGSNVGDAVDTPMHTASAGGQHHGLIAAHLTKFVTGSDGQDIRQPAPTIVACSHSPDTHGGAATPQGVVAAYLAQHNAGFNETVGHEATEPVSTISAKGSQQMVVAGSLAAYYGNDEDGQAVNDPARTVTTKERFGFVESTAVCPMTDEQIVGARCVAAFLRDHGVEFEGEFATVRGYVIVDIGMRMLTPRELFKAQGFPDSYVIDQAWIVDPHTGRIREIKLTKEEQIRMCGNSVSPPPYAAIVAANVPELASWFKGERPKSKVRSRQVLQPA